MDDKAAQLLNGVPYDGTSDTMFRVFKVKYNATAENEAVHKEFQAFCAQETDNSYLMGIKRLLEIAKTDWKYESLYSEIVGLKELLAVHEEKLEAPKQEGPKVPKTFGQRKVN